MCIEYEGMATIFLLYTTLNCNHTEIRSHFGHNIVVKEDKNVE